MPSAMETLVSGLDVASHKCLDWIHRCFAAPRTSVESFFVALFLQIRPRVADNGRDGQIHAPE